MRRVVTAFFMAWGMFLALPCPIKRWDEGAKGPMLAFLAPLGVIVGGLWALAAWSLAKLCCPLPLAALVLTALPQFLTGFMHLDGLMDVADAVLSRRELETKRRILKDPHCGAFGAIALAFFLLAVFALFLSWGEGFSSLKTPSVDGAGLTAQTRLFSLALIPVSVRASSALAVLLLKPMETSGYASMPKRSRAVCASIAAAELLAAVLVPLVPALYSGSALCGLAPAVAAAAHCILTLGAVRSLRGMNGDVSGCSITLGELAGVAALVLIG